MTWAPVSTAMRAGVEPVAVEPVRRRELRDPAVLGDGPGRHRAVKPDVRPQIQVSARRVRRQHVQRIVAAEHEQPEPPLAAEVLVDAGLVVPVDRRRDHRGRALALRDHQRQQLIDVRPARRDAAGDTAAQRPLDRTGRVEKVDVGVAVQLRRLVGLGGDVEDAGGGASVVHAEAARVEVDLVDEVGRQHRRTTQEVVEDRDALAVDEDAGVLRRRAAHHQLADAERDARDAGQVLDHAQRIAEGAGHGRQLVLRQGVARDLLVLALRAHVGLELSAARPWRSSSSAARRRRRAGSA